MREMLFEKSDVINYVTDDVRKEDVVVSIGLMPSKGQAKKNGYSGVLPDGFHEYSFGKNKTKVFTYKMSERMKPRAERFKRLYENI